MRVLKCVSAGCRKSRRRGMTTGIKVSVMSEERKPFWLEASLNRGSLSPLCLFNKQFVYLIELKNVGVLLGVLLINIMNYQQQLLLYRDNSSRQDERHPNRCYCLTERAAETLNNLSPNGTETSRNMLRVPRRFSCAQCHLCLKC